jgi:hypothetical protein
LETDPTANLIVRPMRILSSSSSTVFWRWKLGILEVIIDVRVVVVVVDQSQRAQEEIAPRARPHPRLRRRLDGHELGHKSEEAALGSTPREEV